MKPIAEGKSGLYGDEDVEKVIRFDTVVSVVEGPAHALPRTIGLRKMSLPLSFSRAPAKEDLDDPSFIPTPTRKLSLRLPSLKVCQPSHPPNSPTVGAPAAPLRSCLLRSSPAHQNLRRTTSSTADHEIPSLSSASPYLSASDSLSSSVPLHRVQSPTSSFLHSAFRRNNSTSTSSVASSSNVTSFIDENHGPVETLTSCCPECQASVELGFKSSWEEAPWSQAALKKRERDEKDRLEQEREFGPLEGGRGVVGVGQRNGCVTPNGVNCDDIDGGQIEGFIERVKGVLVDEVSMVRRASQVLKEEKEEGDDDETGSNASPVALVPSAARCPFTSRNSSSSSLPTTTNGNPTNLTPKSSPTTTKAAFPSTSSPSQQRAAQRSVDLHIPLPTSSLSNPSSPISSTLETPVWILGDGSSYDMASRNPMDSPSSTLFPPSPLSLDQSPSSSPSGAAADKEPYFPRVASTVHTPPPSSYKPPASPPLSNGHDSSSTSSIPVPSSPTATITPSKKPSLPTPISSFVVLPLASPRPERARAQSQSATMGGGSDSSTPSSSPRAQPTRSASVPRRRTASPLEVKEAPAVGGVQKIKGMWGMLKGLQIGGAAGVRGF